MSGLVRKTRYKKALSTGKFGFDSTPCTVMGHNILFLSVIFITVVAFGSGKQ